MLIVLFLVSHFNFLFVPCGGLSWLPVSFLLHVKYTVSYRIVLYAAVNLKRNLRSMYVYCTIDATDRHEASRGLSATAGLLVFYSRIIMTISGILLKIFRNPCTIF